MYHTISVAVDNSAGSGNAETLAVQIARATGSSITGLHAYTGRFHRHRFQSLEGHLPERYRKDEIIEHQRSVHSVLIDRGLELIAIEYMKRLRDRCMEAGIPFSEMIVDGKNSDVIIHASPGFGLMAMGAEGLGRIGGISRVGSNTRRMLRHGGCDLLVARCGEPVATILTAIDGSDESYRVVEKAADLSRSLDARLAITTCFDPGLHRTIFGSLSSVLSKEVGNVFRFSEQETLHNEIIDKSLSRLYLGYLEKAGSIARKHGTSADSILLEGKPYDAVCSVAADLRSDLIIVGRNGLHRGAYGDIGSTAENIAEYAGTNVLVVADGSRERAGVSGTSQIPEPSGALHRDVTWSEEAKRRLERVPVFAQPMAVMAIERFAKERGETIVTPEIMAAAREKMGI